MRPAEATTSSRTSSPHVSNPVFPSLLEPHLWHRDLQLNYTAVPAVLQACHELNVHVEVEAGLTQWDTPGLTVQPGPIFASTYKASRRSALQIFLLPPTSPSKGIVRERAPQDTMGDARDPEARYSAPTSPHQSCCCCARSQFLPLVPSIDGSFAYDGDTKNIRF